MISPENLEILKLASSITGGEAVGLRSIDLRLMRSYPSIIQKGELLVRIRSLIELGALSWKQENSSVILTEGGKNIVLQGEQAMQLQNKNV